MRKWFRRLAQGAAGIIGGAIGGPLGALVTVALFELMWPEDDQGGLNGLGMPVNLQKELEEWIDKTGERITFRLFGIELNNKTKIELVNQYCVNAVNVALRQLAALKAYVQFENMYVTPGSDQDKLNRAKIHGINFVIDGIVKVYTEATAGEYTVFKYSTRNFRASDFDKIEALNLDWQGQTVMATTPGYFREDIMVNNEHKNKSSGDIPMPPVKTSGNGTATVAVVEKPKQDATPTENTNEFPAKTGTTSTPKNKYILPALGIGVGIGLLFFKNKK